jgi:hypothetical protein
MGGMTYRTKKRLIMYSCALSVLILISFYVAGHGTKLFEVITVEDQVASTTNMTLLFNNLRLES